MNRDADRTGHEQLTARPSDEPDDTGACRPWTSDRPPQRILVIRLHARGDVLITFPYIKSVRDALGGRVDIDLLCMSPVVETAQGLGIFDRVYGSGSLHSHRGVLVHSLLRMPSLWLRRYDVVLDLQNSRVSRLVRRLLNPRAYVEFDRFSPVPAGERVRKTIDRANLVASHLAGGLSVTTSGNLDSLLARAGWQRGRTTVLLNPAGLYETRSWPLDNYLEFAELWLREVDANSQFVFAGTERMAFKADYLAARIPAPVVNLVLQTSLLEAYALVLRCDLVLSEDGALMHAAWTTGIPLIALLGASRDDWTRPLGGRSDYFSSSDLPCGNCMRDTCQRGDRLCLTRVSPAQVLARAKRVIQEARGVSPAAGTAPGAP